jgi:hypothetical protein
LGHATTFFNHYENEFNSNNKSKIRKNTLIEAFDKKAMRGGHGRPRAMRWK